MELLLPSLSPPSFLPCFRHRGKTHQKHFHATRKMWALEEAKRICRATEMQGSKQVKKREPLRRGIVSPPLPVPDHIQRPPYVGTNRLPDVSTEVQMHDSESIARMKAACQLAARVLEYAGTLVKPSRTTDEIDTAVHQMIIDAGAYPSPLRYGGFPKSVCTSVNECICHGIPDSCELQDGDIINIDVTVYLNKRWREGEVHGFFRSPPLSMVSSHVIQLRHVTRLIQVNMGYHGDTSKTFLCGEVDEASKQLVKVTEECMLRGISACKDGANFKTIGQRISEYVEKYGYGIDCFIGHGVGRIFHSEPIIWHTYNHEPGCMVEGQTFTIEPTLSMGSTQCILWDDGWTTVTVDGSINAQFEHTILITKEGAEILTKC